VAPQPAGAMQAPPVPPQPASPPRPLGAVPPLVRQPLLPLLTTWKACSLAVAPQQLGLL
jgi:hypothetical protein